MKKEQIENMIDKKIENSLSNDLSISIILSELDKMSGNIGKTLVKMNANYQDFDGLDFESIQPIRVRYVVHYLRHCSKRKSDLVWLVRKKVELKKTSKEMFKLLKFKEKMTYH